MNKLVFASLNTNLSFFNVNTGISSHKELKMYIKLNNLILIN